MSFSSVLSTNASNDDEIQQSFLLSAHGISYSERETIEIKRLRFIRRVKRVREPIATYFIESYGFYFSRFLHFYVLSD